MCTLTASAVCLSLAQDQDAPTYPKAVWDGVSDPASQVQRSMADLQLENQGQGCETESIHKFSTDAVCSTYSSLVLMAPVEKGPQGLVLSCNADTRPVAGFGESKASCSLVLQSDPVRDAAMLCLFAGTRTDCFGRHPFHRVLSSSLWLRSFLWAMEPGSVVPRQVQQTRGLVSNHEVDHVGTPSD